MPFACCRAFALATSRQQSSYSLLALRVHRPPSLTIIGLLLSSLSLKLVQNESSNGKRFAKQQAFDTPANS